MHLEPATASLNLRRPAAFAVGLLFLVAACAGTSATAQVPTIQPAVSEPIASPAAALTTPFNDEVPSPGPSSVSGLGTGRPANVNLVLSGTTTNSDGSYSASGPARLCGDAEINLTGNTRAFNFEFPSSGDHQIVDVTFSADDLVPGSTTSAFHVDVAVHAIAGGEPPSTIIDTASGSGNTGSAQLSEAGGSTTLTVQGSGDLGQTLTLTATCLPKVVTP